MMLKNLVTFVFGMFHAHTPEYKEVILTSVSQEDGIVQTVFATITLGMGIDIKATNTIIHYGAPQSIDDYFQDSGREGLSGDPAESILEAQRLSPEKGSN